MVFKVIDTRGCKRRHSPMAPVKVYDDGGPCYGLIRDLGRGGMSFFGLRPLVVGRTYRIEFTHPGIGVSVSCLATIKWSQLHTQGFVCVSRQGLMFEDIDRDTAGKLDEWAEGGPARPSAGTDKFV